MALKVEVAGFGICKSTNPYSVFIICVQQEKFEAWTVYRKYNNFLQLRDQLKSNHPSIPYVPSFQADNLDLENLQNCRYDLDCWLQSITSDSFILRMQSMYQFLCIEANMPPPYLEVHWRDNTNDSFEEMDMEDMFDQQQNDADMDEDEVEEDNDDDEVDWEDEDFNDGGGDVHNRRKSISVNNNNENNSHVFTSLNIQTNNNNNHNNNNNNQNNNNNIQQQQQQYNHNKHKTTKNFITTTTTSSSTLPKSIKINKKKTTNTTSNYNGKSILEDDDEDKENGLDIKSLSVMEAEFLYNRIDEGSETKSNVRNTINLEAFKIMKVIGKGFFFFFFFKIVFFASEIIKMFRL
jgi:hypothetical protein